MDKLLIDINIIMDVILDREIDGSSASLMNLIDQGKVKGFLSATSCATIYYLVHKYLDQRKAHQVIKDLLAILEVSPVDGTALKLALNERGVDFEDNIQIICAKTAKADFIITRNLSHYKYSPIKAISPSEYLKNN